MFLLNCRRLLLLVLVATWAVQPTDAADAPAAVPPGASVTAGARPGTVTLNLKDVPLQDLLDMVAASAGKRYIVKNDAKDVKVSAYLPDVQLEDALEAVLKAYDLVAVDMGSGIVLVSAAPAKEEPEGKEVQRPPLEAEIVRLKYADAYDVRDALLPLLSPYGQVDVVKQSGFTGWGFGPAGREDMSGDVGASSSGGDRAGRPFEARQRTQQGLKREVRSQLLVLKDTAESMAMLRKLVADVDVRPKQVLIVASIVEVARDRLLDVGIDWSLELGGKTSLNVDSATLGTVPGNFAPLGDVAGATPFDAGGTAIFRVSDDFRAAIHALEETGDANVLSAPRLLTLDNQEASILIGTRFPILSSEVSGTEVGQVTTSLDYYENIGIQLNVVPQVQDGRYINMIVHPVVSRQDGSVLARASTGAILAEYPVIDTREAESQVMIEDGQCIAIGGLYKEVVSETVTGVPVLMHIPLLGGLFRRTTTDTQKVDLIILLSAVVINDPSEACEGEMKGIRPPGKTGAAPGAPPTPGTPATRSPQEKGSANGPAAEGP